VGRRKDELTKFNALDPDGNTFAIAQREERAGREEGKANSAKEKGVR